MPCNGLGRPTDGYLNAGTPVLRRVELLGGRRARGDAGARQDNCGRLHRWRARQADRRGDPRNFRHTVPHQRHRAGRRARLARLDLAAAAAHRGLLGGRGRHPGDRARPMDAVGAARPCGARHGRSRRAGRWHQPGGCPRAGSRSRPGSRPPAWPWARRACGLAQPRFRQGPRPPAGCGGREPSETASAAGAGYCGRPAPRSSRAGAAARRAIERKSPARPGHCRGVQPRLRGDAGGGRHRCREGRRKGARLAGQHLDDPPADRHQPADRRHGRGADHPCGVRAGGVATAHPHSWPAACRQIR